MILPSSRFYLQSSNMLAKIQMQSIKNNKGRKAYAEIITM
jgi:hypothetical protein